MQHISDYFGTSFATGTDGDWRTNPTLANILRACNPRLTGEDNPDDGIGNDDNDEGRGVKNILTPTFQCYLRIKAVIDQTEKVNGYDQNDSANMMMTKIIMRI